MGRNAMGQLQKGPQERFVEVTPRRQLHKILTPRQHPTKPEHNDIDQWVFEILTLAPGIRNHLQLFHQGTRHRGHTHSFRLHKTCAAFSILTPSFYKDLSAFSVSSLPPNARRLGTAIRGHWSIENGLHWVLDVVFREDARRLYDRMAAENVAFLNRLALSLLRGDTGKSSPKVKRKRAGWSLPYLRQLLGF